MGFDIHDDKTGHAPAAYMDASEDSTCTLDDSTKLHAWAPSAIFQRAADRIIWRDGPLEAKQFLASKAKRKNPPGSPGTGVVNAIIEACLECGRSGNTAGGTK